MSRLDFRKQFTALERFHFRAPNSTVIMVARIRGNVDEDRLKAVLKKMREKHPLLGARVELDSGNRAWFTTEGVPDPVLEVVPRETADDWVLTAIKESKHLFSLENGPLTRFVLLKSPGVSDLVINARHSICDGLSLAYLIRDILVQMEDPEQGIAVLYPPALEKDDFPVSTSGNFLLRTVIKILNWRWSKTRKLFTERDYEDLHRVYWEKNSNNLVAWQLTEEQTAAFITRCRENKVTVNNALVTALLAAQKEVQGSHQYLSSNIITVDLRKRLVKPVGDVVGFFIATVRPELDYDEDMSYWENTREIGAGIKKLLVNKNIFSSQRLNSVDQSLLDAFWFNMNGMFDNELVAKLVRIIVGGRASKGFTITNLGNQDLPTVYGDLVLEGIYGPHICAEMFEKYMSVTTVGGKMYFMFSFNEAIIEKHTVERLKDVVIEILERESS
ncbi:MAG: condensation domain-containing protein [Candidatus Odinarchaeota archaeon]